MTNLDKVLFPETGFTKGQLIDYYARIAPAMLPHLAGRPLTMKRFPDGVEGKFFFEKRVPSHTPRWVKTLTVPSERQGEIAYAVVQDLPTLIWAANLGTIEFHVPLWRATGRRKLPPTLTRWCSTSTPEKGPPSSSAARWPSSSWRPWPTPTRSSWPRPAGRRDCSSTVPCPPEPAGTRSGTRRTTWPVSSSPSTTT